MTRSGDGAGILLQNHTNFFTEEAVKLGIKLPSFEKYGVGVMLFPKDEYKRAQCRDTSERNSPSRSDDWLPRSANRQPMLGADPLSTEPSV